MFAFIGAACLKGFQIIWRQRKLIDQPIISFQGHFPQVSQELSAYGDQLDNFTLRRVIVFVTGAMFAQPNHARSDLSALNLDAPGVIDGLGEEIAGLQRIEFIDLRLGLEGQAEKMEEGRLDVVGRVDGLLDGTQGCPEVIRAQQEAERGSRSARFVQLGEMKENFTEFG